MPTAPSAGSARPRSPGGPITARFPGPVTLTGDLLRTLYTGCGLTARHIELLTGQPAETIRRALRAAGVRARPPGGRSPFARRVRLAPPAVTG